MRSRRAGREACRWKSSSLVMLGSYACERRGGEPGSLSSYSPIGRGLLQQPRAKRKSSTSCAATTTARPTSAVRGRRRVPKNEGGSAHSRSSAHGKHRRSCRKSPPACLGASGRTGARRTKSSRRAPSSSRRRTPAPSPARSRPSLRHTNRQPDPQIRLNFLAGRRVCEAGVPLTSLSEGVEILGTFTAFSRSIAQCAPSSTTVRTTHSELAAIRRDGKRFQEREKKGRTGAECAQQARNRRSRRFGEVEILRIRQPKIGLMHQGRASRSV